MRSTTDRYPRWRPEDTRLALQCLAVGALSGLAFFVGMLLFAPPPGQPTLQDRVTILEQQATTLQQRMAAVEAQLQQQEERRIP